MSMKKFCIFSQTYSADREELFHFHNKDYIDTNFRNNFDLSLYSFHNSEIDYKTKISNFEYFKRIKNLQIISYDNVSYTYTIKTTLEFLKENKFTHFIFLQDDSFTYNVYDKNIISFIKEEDYEMLSLECNAQELNKLDLKIYKKNNNLEVYNTNSTDFVNRGWYSFDDGAYVAKIDFLLNFIYDEEFYNKDNVWDGENYLNNKIKNNPISRFTTNNPIYRRYNLIGRNNWNRDLELKILNDKLTEIESLNNKFGYG